MFSNSTSNRIGLLVFCCIVFFLFIACSREARSQETLTETAVGVTDRDSIICDGVSASFANPDRLVEIESSEKRVGTPSLKIVGPETGWDLSSHRFVKARLSNTRSVPLKVAFWIVGSSSWDAPVESLELAAGEERLCSVDLKQRWRGGQATKLDSKSISYFRFQTDLSKPCLLYTSPSPRDS